MKSTPHGGFTLIEMMVTLAVAATLLSAAAPSFVALIDDNRAAGAANDVLASLQFARSEAVKRAADVTLCPSSDGAGCSDGTDWKNGWIIFVDIDGNESRDTGEVLLRVHDAVAAAVHITGPTAARFRPAGNTPATTPFAIVAGSSTTRNICMEASGRSAVTKGEAC
jgi:type IV fimbrial biogenesis protein FimT